MTSAGYWSDGCIPQRSAVNALPEADSRAAVGKPEMRPALSTARVQEGFSRQVEGEPNYRGEKGLAQEEIKEKSRSEQISPQLGWQRGRSWVGQTRKWIPVAEAEKPGRGRGVLEKCAEGQKSGGECQGAEKRVGLQLVDGLREADHLPAKRWSDYSG